MVSGEVSGALVASRRHQRASRPAGRPMRWYAIAPWRKRAALHALSCASNSGRLMEGDAHAGWCGCKSAPVARLGSMAYVGLGYR